MKKFKVGIQLYGVRNAMASDFEGTLKALSEMGYEYVEFAGYFGKSSEQILSVLGKYGLKCISVHQSIDFFDESPDEKCEFLRAFGVKYSVIPWYDKKKLASGADWADTVSKFRAAADLLASHGMLLGYHNHDFEFMTHGGRYLHDYIFDAVDADKIFPQLDTCWLRYAGVDPAEFIKKYSGRVPVLHLKDFVSNGFTGGPVYALIDENGNEKPVTREENGFEFRPLGRGIQDFSAILSAAEDCGTDLLIVEQDQTYDISELEAARISREYLRESFNI